MARLDKSQGFTFVYTNIYDLYQKAKKSKLDVPLAVKNGHVIKGTDLKKSQVREAEVKAFEDLKKRKITEADFVRPMGVQEAERKAMEKVARSPLSNLRKNLDNLTEAHSKLRFLLKELEELTKKN